MWVQVVLSAFNPGFNQGSPAHFVIHLLLLATTQANAPAVWSTDRRDRPAALPSKARPICRHSRYSNAWLDRVPDVHERLLAAPFSSFGWLRSSQLQPPHPPHPPPGTNFRYSR